MMRPKRKSIHDKAFRRDAEEYATIVVIVMSVNIPLEISSG